MQHTRLVWNQYAGLFNTNNYKFTNPSKTQINEYENTATILPGAGTFNIIAPKYINNQDIQVGDKFILWMKLKGQIVDVSTAFFARPFIGGYDSPEFTPTYKEYVLINNVTTVPSKSSDYPYGYYCNSSTKSTQSYITFKDMMIINLSKIFKTSLPSNFNEFRLMLPNLIFDPLHGLFDAIVLNHTIYIYI